MLINTKSKSFQEIRDDLLHTNEYKTEVEKLAYANGVLDMFNEANKCQINN